MSHEGSGGKLGFLDSVTRLFRHEDGAPAPEAKPDAPFSSVEAEFEATIRSLNERVEQRLAEAAAANPAAGVPREKGGDRIALKLRRMESAHRAIREDIEKMHGQLSTGLGDAMLVELVSFLRDLASSVKEGKDSHAMLPRARYAIAQKLQTEAGELAVTRLIELLQREHLSWPDPTQQGPSVTAEEAGRSRLRRLAEVREAFLACGLERTADRMLGIVSAWGSGYPERGSPLWEESVLEGVAAGIRADLVRRFVEVLQRDKEQLLARTQGAVGTELAALQRVLQCGITSIEQANQAVASALRVIDEVFPEVAWEHVRSHSPRASGEWPS